MLSEVGPPAGGLQTIVRSCTPRAASARRQSVGHACGGPKLWTRIEAPSPMSATASAALVQICLVGIRGRIYMNNAPRPTGARPPSSSLREDVFEERFQIALEGLGIFAHREVAHFLHLGELRAGNRVGECLDVGGARRPVVLATEQVDRHLLRVDVLRLAGEVVV